MKYADDKGKPGAKLTPAQKKKLAQQFTGYDISHDMVRLSLVNMYLHNLPEPKIFEYDALTSEDKWGERAECILANPPFMSPKGGIRPHKKFAINATRSEVLFADYMLEHLTTGGRAGFIVPEGIIFQSGTAYKQLRKMLVDEGYLWAVVSLPAGVFQPYSGVKTSILLIDRNLAKQNENILFLKIENDGFDLGAQRRAIEKNDLPGALELIYKYKEPIMSFPRTRESRPRPKYCKTWIPAFAGMTIQVHSSLCRKRKLPPPAITIFRWIGIGKTQSVSSNSGRW
jgi:type I restriction enzyme M protein